MAIAGQVLTQHLANLLICSRAAGALCCVCIVHTTLIDNTLIPRRMLVNTPALQVRELRHTAVDHSCFLGHEDIQTLTERLVGRLSGLRHMLSSLRTRV